MFTNMNQLKLLLVFFNVILLVSGKNGGYPGRDEEYRKEIKEQWIKYGECLQQDFNTLGPTRHKLVKLLLVMPGNTLLLQCTTCHRPFRDQTDLEWRYEPLGNWPKNQPNNTNQRLDLSPEMTLSDRMELRISNARPEVSGWYLCYRGASLQELYLVDVPGNATVTQVDGDEEMAKPHTDKMPDTGLVRTVLWGDWSDCSACGKVGKLFKYGVCTLYVDDDLDDLDEPTNNSTVQQTKKQTTQFFSKFTTGIPCSSQILPEHLQTRLKEENSTNLVQVDFCEDICPVENETTTHKFQLKDNGVLQTDTITAMLENLRSKFPQIARKIIDVGYLQQVVIQCPGRLTSETPVTWKSSDSEIIPELIQHVTHGRIKIDLFNRLVLLQARPEDSQIYSCWEKQRLVGTVHLSVDEDEQHMDRHLMLATALLIALLMLFIASKAVRRRKPER